MLKEGCTFSTYTLFIIKEWLEQKRAPLESIDISIHLSVKFVTALTKELEQIGHLFQTGTVAKSVGKIILSKLAG